MLSIIMANKNVQVFFLKYIYIFNILVTFLVILTGMSTTIFIRNVQQNPLKCPERFLVKYFKIRGQLKNSEDFGTFVVI